MVSVSDIAKGYAKYTITTDDIAVAFPGFNKTYGSKNPVDIALQFVGDFDFNMKTTGQAFTAAPNGNITVIMIVPEPNQQVVLAVNLMQPEIATSPFKITADNKISLDITSWKIEGLGFNVLNIPGETPETFAKQFNDFITMAEGSLAKFLSNGIQVPEVLGIKFTDLTAKMNDGSFNLGLSIDTAAWDKKS